MWLASGGPQVSAVGFDDERQIASPSPAVGLCRVRMVQENARGSGLNPGPVAAIALEITRRTNAHETSNPLK